MDAEGSCLIDTDVNERQDARPTIQQSRRDEHVIDRLEARLAGLEREQRWTRRVAGAALFLLAVSPVVVTAANRPPVSAELRAQRFLLEDSNGKVRARLETVGGLVHLTLTATDEKTGFARLSVTDDGKSTFQVENPQANARIVLERDGASSFQARHAKFPGTAAIGLDADGLSRLRLTGRNEKSGVVIGELNGIPGMVLLLQGEEESAQLSMPDGGYGLHIMQGDRPTLELGMKDGMPSLYLYEKDGKGGATMQVLNGAKGVAFADKSGKIRTGIGIKANGDPLETDEWPFAPRKTLKSPE